jgi:hypothetical protein
VLAAPQPTKSFDERSLKMRTITNKINKKYRPLQFFSDGASAAAGGIFLFWTISRPTRSTGFGYLQELSIRTVYIYSSCSASHRCFQRPQWTEITRFVAACGYAPQPPSRKALRLHLPGTLCLNKVMESRRKVIEQYYRHSLKKRLLGFRPGAGHV